MQAGNEKISLLGGAKGTTQPVTAEDTQTELSHGGARPKVRSPKDAKRRRFVMKQAKNLSRGQLLESVSETEEGQQQTLLPPGGESHPPGGGKGRCPEFFGVRSYVHTFYEAMAMDSPQTYEDIGNNNFRYLIAPRKRRRSDTCWQASLWMGIILLVFGLVVLLVGYLVPKRREVVGIQEDIEVIDRTAFTFNRNLYMCKVVGIVVFCSGGSLLAGVLLLLTMVRRHKEEHVNMEEEFRITEDEEEDVPRAHADRKVPATEELATVQPKRGDIGEVVMTNAGLCKVP